MRVSEPGTTEGGIRQAAKGTSMKVRELVQAMQKSNDFASMVNGKQYGVFVSDIGWTYSYREFMTKAKNTYHPEAYKALVNAECVRCESTEVMFDAQYEFDGELRNIFLIIE